jgi:hypothetical protein
MLATAFASSGPLMRRISERDLTDARATPALSLLFGTYIGGEKMRGGRRVGTDSLSDEMICSPNPVKRVMMFCPFAAQQLPQQARQTSSCLV